MIVRKVGEQCTREAHAVDPSLYQTMRGHFHRGGSGAVISHRLQQPMHFQRVRCGIRRARQGAAEARTQGADHAGLDPTLA
jgi:hypothetical protein